jgi:hypothetical protein
MSVVPKTFLDIDTQVEELKFKIRLSGYSPPIIPYNSSCSEVISQLTLYLSGIKESFKKEEERRAALSPSSLSREDFFYLILTGDGKWLEFVSDSVLPHNVEPKTAEQKFYQIKEDLIKKKIEIEEAINELNLKEEEINGRKQNQ